MINQNTPVASITVLAGPEAGTTFSLSKSPLSLGRDPATNDIVLSESSISRQHARIVQTATGWSIEKLAISNTLTVNQKSVQQAMLRHDDLIGLGAGNTKLKFLIMNAATNVLNIPYNQLVPPPPPPNPGSGQYTSTQRVAPWGHGPATALPSIEVSTNTSPDKQIEYLTKPVMSIGRDPNNNDIVINTNIVSAFHAQLVRDNTSFVLVHPHPQARQNRTLNGLLYNGQYIPGDQHFRSSPLKRGDVLRIGDANGTFVTLTYNDGSGAPQEVAPPIQPIVLNAPNMTIGRLPGNDIVLNHPQVSGNHARLVQVAGGHRIIDMGSTNHVYINAQPVTNELLKPNDEIRIGPFKLTYNGTQLIQVDESNCIRIDALNLRKEGNKEGKTRSIILNGISLVIPPRKFVALVGGSGAGKSTLMDALNGLRPVQGTVLYNGQDYYHSLAVFSTQLGYVPQKDIVHQDLTVERALYYAAKMRLPDDFTDQQIKDRINEVLQAVEIAHRRHLLVSKLSGGEKKRVSIALELLAKPSIFFLDEPTSGLDPGLDRKMMSLLRTLADRGQTIVLVTHATNNINVCDYICFLAPGGRLAYFGPPEEAKVYFGKADFAEIYTELDPSNPQAIKPEDAEQRFKASPAYQQYVTTPLSQGPAGSAQTRALLPPARSPKKGNPWKQFFLLSLRYIELLKNDRGNLALLLLQAPVIGALLLVFIFFGIGPIQGTAGGFDAKNIVQCPVGPTMLVNGQPDLVPREKATSTDCAKVQDFLTNDPAGRQYVTQQGGGDERQALQDFIVPGPGEAPKILFIMAFAAVLFGCINGAREIIKEVEIYKRERAVNLGILPYMFSKMVVLGILCLVQSLIIVALVNWVDPFQQSVFLPPFLEISITLSLTSLAGLMLGLTVSALVPNNDRAMSIIPVILIPQVIFSGTLFPLTNSFMQFLGIFFPIRWAMAALGSTVGLHSDKLGGDALFGTNYTYHGLVYSTYDKGPATFYLICMWLVLGVMIVGLACLIGYFLRRKDARVEKVKAGKHP